MPNRPRTTKIRNYLDKHIPKYEHNAIIYTDSLVTALTTNRRNIMSRDVGLALRERDDVENVDVGVWRKK